MQKRTLRKFKFSHLKCHHTKRQQTAFEWREKVDWHRQDEKNVFSTVYIVPATHQSPLCRFFFSKIIQKLKNEQFRSFVMGWYGIVKRKSCSELYGSKLLKAIFVIQSTNHLQLYSAELKIVLKFFFVRRVYTLRRKFCKVEQWTVRCSIEYLNISFSRSHTCLEWSGVVILLIERRL